MSALSLKTLLVPSKEVEVEFPGLPGFKINVAFLSRETLQKMSKKCTVISYKGNKSSEKVNDELFLELYVAATVKGWTGLKLKYLQELCPVDIGDNDPEAELPYSQEDALDLMKGSTRFDSFVSEQISDLGNFNTNKQS